MAMQDGVECSDRIADRGASPTRVCMLTSSYVDLRRVGRPRRCGAGSCAYVLVTTCPYERFQLPVANRACETAGRLWCKSTARCETCAFRSA
eukprot:3240684-Prymnesium_polylepis.1